MADEALDAAKLAADSAAKTLEDTNRVVGLLTPTVPPTPVAPVITQQPEDIEVEVGEAVTLTVAATGTAPLGFQWNKAGADIAGETEPILLISEAAIEDAGSYRCKVSNEAGTVESEEARLIVSEPEQPPEEPPTTPPGAKSVSLDVINPTKIVAACRSGIPMPKGHLKDVAKTKLLDASGQEMPLKAEVMTKWPDGSIRDLLIRTTVQPGQQKAQLIYGDGVSHTNQPFDANQEEFQSIVVGKNGAAAPPVRIIRHSQSVPGVNGSWISVTLLDDREESNVTQVVGKALELDEWKLVISNLAASYQIGTETGQVGGAITGSHSLFQSGELVFKYGELKPHQFKYAGVASGAKATGWCKAGSLTVCVRDFWQQFPKGIEVTKDAVTIYLHHMKNPPQDETGKYKRSARLYSDRPGLAKTYELFIGRNIADPAAYQEAIQNPPALMPSIEWLVNSGTRPGLSAADSASKLNDDRIAEIYTRSVNRNVGSIAYLFGWRDRGDRLRPGWEGEQGTAKVPAFYNGTHIGERVFFYHYLRTGDRRFYELGELGTRHSEIDFSHSSRKGYWKNGYGPGELHARNHAVVDHHAQNVHKGHMHLSGSADLYLMTGDPRIKQDLVERANWAAGFVLDNFKPNGPWNMETKPHWAEAERDYGWPLFTLCEAYRGTGDIKYLEAAASLVKHIVQWWQSPCPHYQNGQVVGQMDWKVGTGALWMYPRSDNTPGDVGIPKKWNGCSPWMLAFLLSAVLRFLKHDETKLVDHALVKQMLLQLCNHMVRWGYDPVKKLFRYSEYPGGGYFHTHQIAYPLAVLSQWVKGAANQQHYTTKDLWFPIAQRFYKSANNIEEGGSGWYGYEFLEEDFWLIMKTATP